MNWSNPSTITTTKVHHGYATAPTTPDELINIHITEAIATNIRKAWWTKLDPGGYILPHVDAGPYHRRWHHPTQPAGYTWHNNTLLDTPTELFEIIHWEPHAVWNPTTTPRIHLLVETDELAPANNHAADLTLYDWPEHLPDTPQPPPLTHRRRNTPPGKPS